VILNISQPYRPPWPVMGIDLLYFNFILQLIDSDGLVMGEKCITLHPKKSHSFHVNFKPQETGASYAKLVFIIQGIHLIVSGRVCLFFASDCKHSGGRCKIIKS
jgi:hypothetical protein